MEHPGKWRRDLHNARHGFVIAMSGRDDLPNSPDKISINSSLSRHKMILLPEAYSDRNGWLDGKAAREGPQLINL